MANKDYNFSAWATRANVKCSDGLIIGKNAFNIPKTGKQVPLMWGHRHDDPDMVLGHAMLFDRDGDVYAECYLNGGRKALQTKDLIENSDILAVSIWANELQKNGNLVVHGDIKELSVVTAGANPEARIVEVIAHEAGGKKTYEGPIYFNEGIDLNYDSFISQSAYDENESDTKEDESMAKEPESANNASSLDEALNRIEQLPDEDRRAVALVLDMILDHEEADDDADNEDDEDEEYDDEADEEAADDNYEEDDTMSHNIFDSAEREEYLAHQQDGLNAILQHSISSNSTSLRRDFEALKGQYEIEHALYTNDTLAHSADPFGAENIGYLFNDPHDLNTTPAFIKRDTGWVSDVMNGAKHQPFSRIRSRFADITADEARAKGYFKGNYKKDEVILLLKRTTEATTVYKKQGFHRDDVIEITSFDILAWIKSEMRMMLDEEIARAALIGDGRPAASEDKIDPNKIRPIAFDEDLFTIKCMVQVPAGADADTRARAFINKAIRDRRLYKGSGNPAAFITEDLLADCLLLEDGIGHPLYRSVADLATRLRVSKIVTVPVMENQLGASGKPLMGIFVNMGDYTFGADKGGSVEMFEDFDIDFNLHKKLIETRCSGALTVPYSAMAFELDEAVA